MLSAAASVVVVGVGTLLLPAPASALSKHTFATAITGSGSDALSDPSAVEVDQSTGDLYVSDPGHFRVEKFTASGEFILMFGKGVNKTAVEDHGTEEEQDVCTAASGDTCQPGTEASTPGAFVAGYTNFSAHGDSLYLAVDNSHGPSAGDVYVGDPGDNLVSKFDSEGHLITGWGEDGRLDGSIGRGGSFSILRGLEGVAVDPGNGALIVIADKEELYEYNQDGSWLAGADDAEPIAFAGSGVAVDGAGHIYDFAGNDGPTQLTVYPPLTPGRYVYDLHNRTVAGPGWGIAIDPTTRGVYVDQSGGLPGVDEQNSIVQYPPSCGAGGEPCAPLDTFGGGELEGSQGLAVASATGTVYVADTGHHRVAAFTALPYLPSATPAAATPRTPTTEELGGTVNPIGAEPVATTGCQFEYVPADDVQTLTVSGATGGTFTLAAPGEPTLVTQPIPFDSDAEGVESALEHSIADAAPGVTAAVSGPSGGPYRLELTGTFGDAAPQISVEPSGLIPPGATATITDEPGVDWPAAAKASCSPSSGYSGTEPTAVTGEASALAPGTAYDFRLAASNEHGSAPGYPQEFTTLPLAPMVGETSAGPAFAETAQIHVQIDPDGGEATYHTSYHVEYVTSEQWSQSQDELLGAGEPWPGASQSPSLDAGSFRSPRRFTAQLKGLLADTTYHYRVLASNECQVGGQCVVAGEAHTFTTLPLAVPVNDTCPNAQVRQQTSAAQLLDCRAYELVSAPYTAGYDVESNLIEGQTPFAGYPEAEAPSGEPRVLYGIHDGGVPGAGEPTNRGVDPYVATRTPEGWSTEYVGIPADATASKSPFGSPLLEADQSLDTFAFGGPGLCSPCFGEGIQIGIPLHLPRTEKPVQGMAGPLEPSEAAPDGYIARAFSADGTHLVFGSVTKFAEGGNEETGDATIYDRDLKTGETHAVSDDPEGEPLSCLKGAKKCHSPGDSNGIAELDISADGSHLLLAQKVSEDVDHNVYWHLYMDVDDSSRTIDLTPGIVARPGGPGFKEGVLFDGMTADGSEVFFTTKDRLLPAADTDESADIYMWSQKGEEAGEPLTLISTGEGTAGNSDACDPVANGNDPHWNSLEATPECGAVAIAGGGGVAAGSGSIYFLSPEQLQPGHGTENQPNLYLATPGLPPHFIATLEPEGDPLVTDAVKEAAVRHTADFQLTPDGEFAAFPSSLALAGAGEEPVGHTVIYRYDAATSKLACASCTLTGLPSEGNSSLASDGLSLAADGRLFFNSTDSLVATDTDERQDVYEWEEDGSGNCTEESPSFARTPGACLALISAGTSTSPSGLLSTDTSGKDVYFFTRDSLAPQDENGPVVKVYDARDGGGFPYVPPREDCKASDECHGAASPPPPPIEARTLAGAEDNVSQAKACRKGFAFKHGRCVRKPKSHHHRGKHHKRTAHHKRGGKK